MTVGTLRELLGPNVRIADGGVGTGLQSSSLEAGQPPEELALDAPDELVELHCSFIRAGSDIVLTDTFGANPVRLGHSKYQDVERINRAAVACARTAVELSERRDVLVAGSIGPTGELLVPLGTLEPTDARVAFAAQASALAGCDLLVVETMFSLDEARAALLGCRESTDLPVVVSFSFDAGAAEPRTMMGHSVEDVVLAMAELGADGVGFNCGASLERRTGDRRGVRRTAGGARPRPPALGEAECGPSRAALRPLPGGAATTWRRSPRGRPVWARPSSVAAAGRRARICTRSRALSADRLAMCQLRP